jgi:hypothetical protein
VKKGRVQGASENLKSSFVKNEGSKAQEFVLLDVRCKRPHKTLLAVASTKYEFFFELF